MSMATQHFRDSVVKAVDDGTCRMPSLSASNPSRCPSLALSWPLGQFCWTLELQQPPRVLPRNRTNDPGSAQKANPHAHLDMSLVAQLIDRHQSFD